MKGIRHAGQWFCLRLWRTSYLVSILALRAILRLARWYWHRLRRGFVNAYFAPAKPKLVHSEKQNGELTLVYQNSNTKPMNWCKDVAVLVGFVTSLAAFVMMF